MRGDRKGRLSSAFYLIAILVAFLWTWVSLALYVVAALLWLVPDLTARHKHGPHFVLSVEVWRDLSGLQQSNPPLPNPKRRQT